MQTSFVIHAGPVAFIRDITRSGFFAGYVAGQFVGPFNRASVARTVQAARGNGLTVVYSGI